jgi:hypothetical protein
MGVKTNILAVTPTTTHIAASKALGRDASETLAVASLHMDDSIAALRQLLRDATVGAPLTVSAATVQAGGTGHAANDLISLANGVVIKVLTVSSGVIQTISVQSAGSVSDVYVAPSNPQPQVLSSGAGINSAFNLTWVSLDGNVSALMTQVGNLS